MKKLLTLFLIAILSISMVSAKSLKRTVKYEVIEATASQVDNLGAAKEYTAIIKIGKEFYTAVLDSKYESPSLIKFIEDQKEASIIEKQNKRTNKLFR